jgi:hypothetical protein
MSSSTQARQVIMSELSLRSDGSSKAVDMLSMYKEISIFEDMFDPFVSMTIEIIDTTETIGPNLKSGDIVTIKFKHPVKSEEMKFTGRIYTVVSREQISMRSQSYKFAVCSSEMYFAMNKMISRSFQNRTCADMIGSILENDLESKKPYVFDRDVKEQSIVIPSKRPLAALEMIAERAISDTGASSYLFFETLYGFVFKTVNDIIEKAKRSNTNYKVYYVPRNNSDKTKDQTQTFVSHFAPIEQTQENEAFSQQHGFHGSEVFSYDIAEKKMNIVKKEASEGDLTTTPTRYLALGSSEIGLEPEKWLGNNAKDLAFVYRDRMQMVCSGDPVLRCGMVIDFVKTDTSASLEKTSVTQRDTKQGDLHLIIALHHRITRTSYDTILETSKL